ncbi:MAG: 1,6-anhydro-N-acetylmuramyl-L-alanine amidase AmpD [Pseudomonadota bacterium]
MQIVEHRLDVATQVPAANFDERPENEISLIVVHGISLPAGHFGGDFISRLFSNRLDVTAHADFRGLGELRVSSHLLIRRDGTIYQYVPFDKRAWHAGVSSYAGREACNDFSVGIELEGTDQNRYREAQYRALAKVCCCLIENYGIPATNIAGHRDIAPGRKTDPGEAFDWAHLFQLINDEVTS